MGKAAAALRGAAQTNSFGGSALVRTRQPLVNQQPHCCSSVSTRHFVSHRGLHPCLPPRLSSWHGSRANTPCPDSLLGLPIIVPPWCLRSLCWLLRGGERGGAQRGRESELWLFPAPGQPPAHGGRGAGGGETWRAQTAVQAHTSWQLGCILPEKGSRVEHVAREGSCGAAPRLRSLRQISHCEAASRVSKE